MQDPVSRLSRKWTTTFAVSTFYLQLIHFRFQYCYSDVNKKFEQEFSYTEKPNSCVGLVYQLAVNPTSQGKLCSPWIGIWGNFWPIIFRFPHFCGAHAQLQFQYFWFQMMILSCQRVHQIFSRDFLGRVNANVLI